MPIEKSKFFAYGHGDKVTIAISGETGHVVSRMDSAESSDQYQVRYKTAFGEAAERWWAEEALEAAPN